MQQSQKMIANREIAIQDIARINADLVAVRNFPLAYRNMCEALEKRFDTALLRWRLNDSPVRDLKSLLFASDELLKAIVDWQITDDILIEYGDIWNIVRYSSYLTDVSIKLPCDRLIEIRKNRSRYADIALDYCLLDIFSGRECHSDFIENIQRLSRNNRQKLAAKTWYTYMQLLDENNVENRANLLRDAEINYERRMRDSFYSGGPTYMGGGPANPYVVDFRLAAILKYLHWSGDTAHRWIW